MDCNGKCKITSKMQIYDFSQLKYLNMNRIYCSGFPFKDLPNYYPGLNHQLTRYGQYSLIDWWRLVTSHNNCETSFFFQCSGLSALISPCLLHPLLLIQLSPYSPSIHQCLFSEAFLFSFCLAASISKSFVQYIH